MKNRATQKEAIFYILYTKFRSGDSGYLPVFKLMGETFIKEINKWAYVSYECSARASDMMKENPGLFHRTKLEVKSGARYYGYRMSPLARPEFIQDKALLDFYKKIKKP